MATREQGMPFFRDFFVTLQKLDMEDRGKLVTAMCEYFFDGEEVELEGAPDIAWTFIKRSLDTSKEISEHRKEAGRRGGKAKTKQSDSNSEANGSKDEASIKQTEANAKQASSKDEVNGSEQEQDQEQEHDQEPLVGGALAPTRAKRAAFRPPTVEEITEYANARSLDPSQAQPFIDHYGSIGWVVGRAKTPMKDWHRAYSGWLGRQKQFDRDRASPQPEKQPDPAMMAGLQDLVYERVEMDLEGYDLG